MRTRPTLIPARSARGTLRDGFTLVEILVVIAIIGVLVAITVPAVNIAYRSVKQRAIALECQALATSIEAYRTKFDDYPPDGADSALLLRHLKKAFPNISPTEIDLLTKTGKFANWSGVPVASSANSGAVMDPSEALVFFLGGFSDDSVFPFSGKDGPIYILDDSSPPQQVKSSHAVANISSIQYNPDRKNSLYDFKQGQLTLTANAAGLTVSTDDTFNSGVTDLLPAYHPSGLQMPFVYFESRTYQQTTVANRYATTSNGIVYPYRSAQLNTKYASDMSIPGRNKYYRFMNDKTFQLISAGLDDHFGGEPGFFYAYKPLDSSTSSGTGPASGDSIDLANSSVGTYTRFKDASGGTYQDDNVANFAEGTFADSLDN